MSDKTYVFTREVRRWGVEAGDYYNPDRHRIVGGTEKLLEDGVIEQEVQCEICVDTGVVATGEFDDVTERKCVCQVEEPEHDRDQD